MRLRKRVLYDVQGTPMSTVQSKVEDIASLSSDDFLLASQPRSTADAAYGGWYKSAAVPFDAFFKQLSACIAEGLGLGSAAYEDVSAFAAQDHVHPEYSQIEISSFCDKNDRAVLCSIVTFEDDGYSCNMSIPDTRSVTGSGAGSLMLAPQIGEMRLMAAASVARLSAANSLDMDMQSSTFSGWVVPNGQTVDAAKFPGAAKVFGSQLPALDGDMFMKLQPFAAPSGQQATQMKPATAPLQVHQHAVVANGIDAESKKAGVDVKYTLTYKIAKDRTVDWSQATVDPCEYAFEYGVVVCSCTSQPLVHVAAIASAKLDERDIDVEVLEAGSKHPQTQPSSTEVIALLYIGKPYSDKLVNEEEHDDGLRKDSAYDIYQPSAKLGDMTA